MLNTHTHTTHAKKTTHAKGQAFKSIVVMPTLYNAGQRKLFKPNPNSTHLGRRRQQGGMKTLLLRWPSPRARTAALTRCSLYSTICLSHHPAVPLVLLACQPQQGWFAQHQNCMEVQYLQARVWPTGYQKVPEEKKLQKVNTQREKDHQSRRKAAGKKSTRYNPTVVTC